MNTGTLIFGKCFTRGWQGGLSEQLAGAGGVCVFLKSLDSFQDPDPFAIIRTQLFFDVNA